MPSTKWLDHQSFPASHLQSYLIHYTIHSHWGLRSLIHYHFSLRYAVFLQTHNYARELGHCWLWNSFLDNWSSNISTRGSSHNPDSILMYLNWPIGVVLSRQALRAILPIVSYILLHFLCIRYLVYNKQYIFRSAVHIDRLRTTIFFPKAYL